ncbi:MAG: glycoside hydrolase family 3 C-terminal domain-containing protein [Lachnospiraceae bacterium]|nr:glycoside hydrolase family 3 C-terminal domain-containing protein [Lachnospiraceae bacterium]
MKTNKRGRLIAIVVLLIAALAVNIACNSLKPMITSWMGANLNPLLTGKKPVENAEILSVADATEQSLRMAERLEEEGIVLLRNENHALPLAAGTKVNLFGYASIDPIYGGTGSGSGDTSANVDVITGLTDAGLQVNEQLVNFYRNSGVGRPKQGGYSGSNFTPAEVPVDQYTDDLLKAAREYSDTAIIVLSRIGGEGGDLPMDMYAAGYSKADDGRHYLELTQDEEDLLNLVKEQHYEKVVVLINSSNAMELGFVQGVDACLWVGSPGAVGFRAVGSVLTGAVNPSGRLTDIYAYDLTTAPAYYNAGSFTYGNLKRNYVEYAEGIYVGYRYYETAAADGFLDYEQTVQYPFGYGLSYTTFSQSIESFVDGGGNIILQVKVENTGSVPGKDVVQVYYTAPYTKGGIEKAHVVLAGFGKTKLLNPGESEILTISFREEDMASFDSKGAGCYVLEAGDYVIKLMSNSHQVIDSRIHTVAQTVTYGEENARSTDKTAAVARFADVEDGQITVYLSRADWAGTFPKSRVDGKEASAQVVEAFTNKAPYAVNDNDAAVQYADNGLTLTDMAGLRYDDPKWEQLLQQLSDEDMTKMILNGGWSTPAVESVGKPATSDLDGPAGINSLVSSLRGVSFPSEAVIGATWNMELVEEFGKVFGAEAISNGVVGLYAPGMNIHRTPFSGRNFEYYSEDGFLSGKLGAAEVKGAATQGVYMYAKHFALNDQESNRLSISVWANEQSMREIYLKPFEITVKEGGTTAIMSSYSHLGTVWAGACRPLLTEVLRGEWGFTGMVVTDSAMANTSWMDANLAVRAGNDMMLCLMGASIDSSNNTARQAMREACHNILYTQANSAAVQVESDNTPYWYGLIALFNAIVLSVILILLLNLAGRKTGWKGLLIFLLMLAISAAVLWFCFLQPKSQMDTGKEEVPGTSVESETGETPSAAEISTAEGTSGTEENAVSPENGMELYELADFWLGCHVKINADNTFSVAYDYNAENSGIVSLTGTWERVSETELTLKPETGDPITVTLADGAWSCEVTEPNTQTKCHPKVEVGAEEVTPAAVIKPETGMELYELADFWLGCHVKINADNTFSVAYDYNAENSGIVSLTGTWERVSETELTLKPETGDPIAVTLADGAWSCEVTEPNTQTKCHPKTEVGNAEPADTPVVPESKTYTVIYTDKEGVEYARVETTDASALPEVEIPVKEGFTFAGWQTRPDVSKADLILGVSPYEVAAGASSLYGGAGMAIDQLESTEDTVVTVYARWVEPMEIHNAEELKAMAQDLYGNYVLANDVDLSEEQWIPIGMYFSTYETVNAPYWTFAFRGTFDGAGHKLTGLNIGNYVADASAWEAAASVWRNDGVYSGSEAALFGALAKANIHDLIIEKPVLNITSDGDATPYAAALAGFDIGSQLTNITVTEPIVSVTVNDQNAQSRATAWAAVSGLVAGGWSDVITNCAIDRASITLNAETIRSHGGEFYVGSMLGEGYAFMDGNSATYDMTVNVEDKSTALTDAELIVNIGGMGGTNTTQTNGNFDGKMHVHVVKPAGNASVSIGGLTGSQRYQVAEKNTIKADITTDCQLDPENGRLYVGKVIGSTNIPYCIIQLLFAAPGSVDYAGCRLNTASVLHNGEEVTALKGEVLTVNDQPLTYIANGDITAGDMVYTSNINEVIARFGAAVPAAFLQKSAIVFLDE